MPIQLVDLGRQYRALRKEIDAAIAGVIEAGNFIGGPRGVVLEQTLAAYCGVRHGVGLNSGTDALILALRALGIGPGDEVIVPAFTFFAPAEAVSSVGARPVFVDVDSDTYCMDIGQTLERVTPRTRAVIPVHLFGHPADMAPLVELSREKGISIIEDNAQAIGAMWQDKRTGGIGRIGCISFYPTKNLGAYGDGGMLLTNEADVADLVRQLRTHGWKTKYEPTMIGVNSRLDEIQAAVLLAKMKHLDDWNALRRSKAARYRELIDADLVSLPLEKPGVYHVYHLFVVRVPGRARVQKELASKGIQTAVYYPVPLHLLAPYREFGYKPGDCPVSEQAAQECLAIPLFPEITEEEQEMVASALNLAVKAVKG